MGFGGRRFIFIAWPHEKEKNLPPAVPLFNRHAKSRVLPTTVPSKRLGIFLPLPKSHKIDNTRFPISISNNILYPAPFTAVGKQNLHPHQDLHSSSLCHKHTTRAMDATKNPIKLVKVTRVLGRTGLSPRTLPSPPLC